MVIENQRLQGLERMVGSMASFADQPENEREKNAEENGSRQGKIEGGVFAAIIDVTRKTANGQMKAAGDQQHSPQQCDHDSQNQQELTQFGHEAILDDW